MQPLKEVARRLKKETYAVYLASTNQRVPWYARILAYNKVQMLYLFQSKQVETVREVSAVLGKSEATIHRWLFQYKEGGLENLLKNRQVFGRPKKFSVEIAASLQQELRDPEGFQSYKEVHLWLGLIKGIDSSYPAVYS